VARIDTGFIATSMVSSNLAVASCVWLFVDRIKLHAINASRVFASFFAPSWPLAASMPERADPTMHRRLMVSQFKSFIFSAISCTCDLVTAPTFAAGRLRPARAWPPLDEIRDDGVSSRA
jgi:hypothetical protein